MKQLISSLITCLAVFFTIGQEFPDYGRIKPDEIRLTECSFDKDAEAVILVHEAYADHDDQYKLITKHHVRLKILKEKGVSYGDVRIPYYSKDDFERIDNVRGTIFNHDGISLQFQELERKSIFKKNINKYYSEVVFAFPAVKVGSIIEYTYESTMANYGGLDDWKFQQDIPVVSSKYSVVVLPNYEFAYRIQRRDDLPIKITPHKGSGRIAFEMNNIPALRSEPYMDARKDYLQMVTFQLAGVSGRYSRKYMTTWQDVIRELTTHAGFGNQLGKQLDGTRDFIAEVKLDPSGASRISKVYNFVRSRLVWNGFTSLYSGDGIRQAWSKSTGTSGEINLILTSLLKEVNVEAYPLLVSEREHGKVNSDIPFIEQFNTVYAYAIADGKKFYLDGRDKHTPAHIIPFSILNTTALIVNKKNGGLVKIADDQFQYRDYLNIIATLTADGHIAGEVFMSSTEYARSQRLTSYRTNSAAYVKRFTGSGGNFAIDSFRLINEQDDTLPLQHKFRFSSPVNSTGDYSFIPTTFFSELEGNPFMSDVRFSNINFGYRQTMFLNAYVAIPEGFVVDGLPKSVRVMNEGKNILFTRSVLYDEKARKVISRISVEMKKSLYQADEYPALQEFYKRMYDYLAEQIVIKKS
jgi:uncharacterized protein DUF3857